MTELYILPLLALYMGAGVVIEKLRGYPWVDDVKPKPKSRIVISPSGRGTGKTTKLLAECLRHLTENSGKALFYVASNAHRLMLRKQLDSSGLPKELVDRIIFRLPPNSSADMWHETRGFKKCFVDHTAWERIYLDAPLITESYFERKM